MLFYVVWIISRNWSSYHFQRKKKKQGSWSLTLTYGVQSCFCLTLSFYSWPTVGKNLVHPKHAPAFQAVPIDPISAPPSNNPYLKQCEDWYTSDLGWLNKKMKFEGSWQAEYIQRVSSKTVRNKHFSTDQKAQGKSSYREKPKKAKWELKRDLVCP